MEGKNFPSGIFLNSLSLVFIVPCLLSSVYQSPPFPCPTLSHSQGIKCYLSSGFSPPPAVSVSPTLLSFLCPSAVLCTLAIYQLCLPSAPLVLSRGPDAWHRMSGHHSKKKLPLFSGAPDWAWSPHAVWYVFHTPAAQQLMGCIGVLWFKNVFWSWIHFCYGNSPKDMA